VFFIIYCALSVLLAVFYAYFFVLYIKHWDALPFFKKREHYTPHTFISVLIPARNEEDNILQCIDSILNGSYPHELFEIIVIDDHSDDLTPQYVRNLGIQNVRLIELKNYIPLGENQPFKKRAIEAAIGESKGDLIVTTDADCLVLKDWLTLFAQYYEIEGKRFIAAPVNFHEEQSLFERFQSLDYIGMMGITGAGVQGNFTHMCNGANLAYEKKLFHEVDGFKGIDHVASGDDMLLMQKIARFFPKVLGFLKNADATVYTKAKPTIKDFFSQRLRWASKSSSYTEGFTVFQLFVVFLFYCTIVLNVLMSFVWDSRLVILVIAQILIKILFDYAFLKIMTRFFSRQDLMAAFLRGQMMHLIYIIFVGLLSNVKKKYTWKGRTVK
jgi:cellulose synthase/poly-beta-1,6-N-acetylglucosamine synthase-like glycosyltransferase